jgi:hypothetical protein
MLYGLTLKIPPSALLHPQNSDKITALFYSFFSDSLTAINSMGRIDYPSLKLVTSKKFDTCHKAILSVRVGKYSV